MPLFHNTAQAMITLPVLLIGAKMVLVEKFSATRFWPEVRADLEATGLVARAKAGLAPQRRAA